ncbi:MAG: type VI secretion system Vgr family protein, partial [Desulfobacterales bacterium]
EIRVGKYTVNDFNFEMPATDLKAEVTSQYPFGPGEREVYDYPAEYSTKAEADRLANIRIQEEEAKITNITGTSTCRAFSSGYRYDLLEYYRDDMNDKSYVLVFVNHGAYEAVGGSGEGAGASYTNSFTCIPFDVPFRPPLATPKPMIGGVQTAIVVGPSGEEIYTDEHGRVKVQFHWDREGQKDENSSCWIRVSQLWAGAGWGAMYIPRIGQEVIVDFLEGDPDRPIIAGRVYHGINMPPYGLPAEKTKSTIKSDSSLGGGGSNEFRFEDKKGEEEVYLHGQKDWTIAIENDKNQTVGHDESLSVGNNRTKTVGVDQSETIGSNKTIQVGANHTESIGSNMSQTVSAAKTETIALAKVLTIGAAYQVSVGAAMNETIGAAKAEAIGGAKSVNVGINSSENVAKDKSVDVGGDISENAEKNISIKSGKKMKLSADDDFTITGKKKGVIDIKEQLIIKCGSASITLKKNGDISIKGKKINVKGSGDVIIKGSSIKEN